MGLSDLTALPIELKLVRSVSAEAWCWLITVTEHPQY